MAKHNKQISNPFSSGGGGTNFETRVQASFVTLMLSGSFAPCLPPWPIKKIKLQGKYKGFDTDDAIVFVESPDRKEERKLLCQIKHSISITEKNKIFGDVIQAAWNDFTNPKLFTIGKDLIALVSGPLSSTDINHVRWILEEARHSECSADFLTKVNLGKFSSKAKIKKLAVFREELKNANGGNKVSDDVLWQFLKSFYLLGYDLDIKAGVTLSLVQSLIGQYVPEKSNALWAQIVDEVQSANQNAGTVTIASLPEDIRNAFQKRAGEKIPTHLGIKPSAPEETNWNNFEFVSELALVNVLGGWDEKSEGDQSVIEELITTPFDDWISKVRRILQEPDSPLSLRNGVWTVVKRQEMWQALGSRIFDDHLNKFKQIIVTVLKESDPKFELSPDKRYGANVYGKVLKHSHNLRKGLAESLALLGNQPEVLKNCSLGKAETIAIASIREIFKDSDWVRWASLNDLLPTLAEAAPWEFLAAVEGGLKNASCPFDELFSQEGSGITGASYMTGLLWALEGLAWEKEYLVQATVLLGKLASRDPGGNWGNRPGNSLTTIFLPWFPQTIASINKRKAAIHTLERECPDIAWKLLLDLLPNQHQTSMGSHKPMWRNIIPNDYEVSVTKKEYWEQISSYAEIAVEIAKGDFDKLNELISDLDNLPAPSFGKFLECLKCEEIKKSSEEKRTPLWEELVKFTIKHKKYSDADWALSPELVENIEQVAKDLIPRKPQNLHRHLFSEGDLKLYEESGNWQEQRQKLEKYRQNAIREILTQGGFEAVFHFAKNVECSRKVGFSLGMVAEDNMDLFILPDLFETGNNKIAEFTTAFIWGRHSSQGWKWVNRVNTANWTNAQIGQFLSYLPFTKETWEYSKQLLGKFEVEYWSRANIDPFQSKSNLDYAVDKLLQHNRPNAAISCLYGILHDKKSLDKNRAVDVLLKAVSSDEPAYSMDAYNTVEIIEALQDDPEVNQDDLFKIEWVYLPLLTGPGRSASPKVLEQKLASDPDFFCELIRSLYRSKKETEREKTFTEQQKNIASNAWNLFRDWRIIPGKNPDGSFSCEKFHDWLESVKTKCKESGHLEVALSTIGEVLIHYTRDPDGLWIHRALAEALNAEDAEKMRRGFSRGIFNSLGVHFVDPTGKPEKELAAKYRQQAEEVEDAGYYRFAITLKGLADSYEHEAERIIREDND